MMSILVRLREAVIFWGVAAMPVVVIVAAHRIATTPTSVPVRCCSRPDCAFVIHTEADRGRDLTFNEAMEQLGIIDTRTASN